MEYLENCEYHLWKQSPLLTAVPKKRLKYSFRIYDELITESAIFLLENGIYLYICFCGPADNDELGTTITREFEKLEEAEEFYHLFKGD